jgi:hypothetical protein
MVLPCAHCQVMKPKTLEFYHANSANRNGLHSYCIPCQRYRRRQRTNRRITKRRELMDERDCVCVDCGKVDYHILEWDHNDKMRHLKHRGPSSKRIVHPISLHPKQMKAELELCEIRCGNCHKERTFGDPRLTYRNPLRKERFMFVFSEKVLRGGCMDCGYANWERSHVLHFDHRPEEQKVLSVSMMVCRSGTYSLEDMQTEMDKCDLVCSNCHKVRTRERRIESVLGDPRKQNPEWKEKREKDDEFHKRITRMHQLCLERFFQALTQQPVILQDDDM